MQVQNTIAFDLSPTRRQEDYLEQLFYATRTTYNELLRRFTQMYNCSITPIIEADACVKAIAADLERLKSKPEHQYIKLAPHSVMMGKVEELSALLTVFLVQDEQGTAQPLKYEDRHLPSTCLFPTQSFYVKGNLLYLPAMEVPFEMHCPVATNIDPLSVRITRLGLGKYTAKLLTKVAHMQEAEALSF